MWFLNDCRRRRGGHCDNDYNSAIMNNFFWLGCLSLNHLNRLAGW